MLASLLSLPFNLKKSIYPWLWINPFKIWTKAVAACHQIKTTALVGARTQPSKPFVPDLRRRHGADNATRWRLCLATKGWCPGGVIRRKDNIGLLDQDLDRLVERDGMFAAVSPYKKGHGNDLAPTMMVADG